jgi:hypothetical protein
MNRTDGAGLQAAVRVRPASFPAAGSGFLAAAVA